jgi:Ca2+/Na+ antiporter
MAATNNITDHEWQDLACMGLGVLILLSPWVVSHDDMGPMVLNTVVVGLAVLLVSELELAGHSVRKEAANGIAGLWLMASPFVFGYDGELQVWHLVLGALVTIFAAVEFWQERGTRRRPQR